MDEESDLRSRLTRTWPASRVIEPPLPLFPKGASTRADKFVSKGSSLGVIKLIADSVVTISAVDYRRMMITCLARAIPEEAKNSEFSFAGTVLDPLRLTSVAYGRAPGIVALEEMFSQLPLGVALD